MSIPSFSSTFFFVLATSVVLFGCGQESNTNTPPPVSDTVSSIQADPGSAAGFYDVPSPIQQAQLLQKAGAGYDKSILNPLDNVSKYSLTNSKALNLGVYGADLSYATVYNQAQDVILYLAVSQELAESLGMKNDFYAGIMKRMEKNNGNKDSLLAIVSDVYRRSNESLKENDQSHISALVIAGSFIEGMYLGTQIARTVDNKDAICERIGQFRGSLNSLVGLITTVHDSNFSGVLEDLRAIKAIYDESPGSALTDAQMVKLTKEVKAVRIRITNS